MPRKKADSNGLARMSDAEFEALKLETKEQTNFQIGRQLKNKVLVEKWKADASDLDVKIAEQGYKKTEFKLKAAEFETLTEEQKTKQKFYEMEGSKGRTEAVRQRVNLEAKRDELALESLSLDIDKITHINGLKKTELESMGASIESRVNAQGLLSKLLFGEVK